MTDKEMRELDAWIAEHVMGWKLCDRKAMGWCDGPPVWLTGGESSPTVQGFIPTKNPHDAMEVLKRCGEKLGETVEDIRFGVCQGYWTFHSVYRECPEGPGRILFRAICFDDDPAPFELTICLFAQKLFGGAK